MQIFTMVLHCSEQLKTMCTLNFKKKWSLFLSKGNASQRSSNLKVPENSYVIEKVDKVYAKNKAEFFFCLHTEKDIE